jgi:hypothetical protein
MRVKAEALKQRAPESLSDLIIDYVEGKASMTEKWMLYSILKGSTASFHYDTVYLSLVHELETTKGGY